MIQAHQPTIFGKNLVCAFSSRQDDTVLTRSLGRHSDQAVQNRKAFLRKLNIAYSNVVYQVVSYADLSGYNTYALVDKRTTLQHEPLGAQADALITNTTDVALFLPVADCVAIALHDPVNNVIASVHAGRHSTVTDVIARVVGAMQLNFGSNPADILAWLSPSAQAGSYVMDYFDQADLPEWQPFAKRNAEGKINIDLAGFNRFRLIEAGLSSANIQMSAVDTASNPDYFSHSQGDTQGRMAMVVMMCEQGEPAL